MHYDAKKLLEKHLISMFSDGVLLLNMEIRYLKIVSPSTANVRQTADKAKCCSKYLCHI